MRSLWLCIRSLQNSRLLFTVFSGAREELSDVVSQLETMMQHGDPIDNFELARIEGRIKSSIEELDRFMGVNVDFYVSFGDLLEGFVQYKTEPES